jgi:ABC-type glycerol-3-phosphate transport system permease component
MGRKRVETYARFALGLFACVVYIIPLFWMVSTSLKPVEQIFQKPPVLFPSSPQVDSYRSILGLPTNRPDIYINTVVYFKNSLYIATWTTILVFLLAVPGAYALSRFKFRGRSAYLLFLLVAQMLPSVLLVIPLFVLFKRLGLYSTYLGVILADTAIALPFAIIILRTSLIQIPDTLEEAAWIDGGSRIQVLWFIILPLVRAGLIAVGVFSFLTAWGEFVFAYLSCQNRDATRFIRRFPIYRHVQINFDTMMAFSTLVAIPAIVAFLLLQRQFVSGLTSGSVK